MGKHSLTIKRLLTYTETSITIMTKDLVGMQCDISQLIN